MKGAWVVFVVAGLAIVGCVAIGAWLAVHDHPWFALLAMLTGGHIRVREE